MKTTCPVCQHEASLLLRVGDLNRRLSDDLFSYYRCPNCHLIFLRPIPANLGDYYTDSYYQVPKTLEDLKTSAQRLHHRVDLVKGFRPGGRLLEIGASYGGFAYLAQEAGFKVDAVEMDAACCAFLRDVLKMSVIEQDDPVAALRGLGEYDVMTLWHVIEHVPDPIKLLQAMVEHLAPGGIIVMATPNPESLQFKLFQKRWTHLEAPRHLTLIPRQLLADQGQALGLKTALVTTNDPDALAINWMGWNGSPQHYFRQPSLRWLMSVAGRAAHKLMIPFERSGLRGSAYTMVLQKPA